MKKFLYISILSSMILGTAALVGGNEIKQTKADSTYSVTTDWASYGTSPATLGTGSVGNECKVSFKVDKGGSNEVPTNYQSSGGGAYYIRLKYNSTKTSGTLGAYVEFSCTGDYTFDTMSWKAFKVKDKCGYQIDTKSLADQSFSNYAFVEKITSTSGVNYTFEATTQVIRIYHYFSQGTESSHDQLYISDITFGLSPLVSKTLSFDTNGGETMTSVKYGLSQKTIKPADPIKASTSETKYVFAGWYTDKSCSEKEFSFGSTLSEDTTIYAKWNEVKIESAQLSSNFYKEAVKKDLGSGATYSFKNTSIDLDLYDGEVADANFYITATASNVSNCNLRNYTYQGKDDSYLQLTAGHSTHFTGSHISIKPIANQETFSIQSVGFEIDKNPDHTTISGCISYRYSVDGDSFTEFSNGASFENSLFTISSLPMKIRYFELFIDKYNNVSGSAFITKVSVNYTKESNHTLSFDTNGGNEMNSVTLAQNDVTVRPTDPVRPNEGSTKFTFDGWYTDKACSKGNEFDFGYVLTENMTIYAKWVESQVTGYALTFHTNGAHTIEPQVAEEGSCFSEPIISEIIKDEKYVYTLSGWYADEGLTTEFDFTKPYMEDQDAYAKYSYAQNTLVGATEVGMKSKVKEYGNGWSIDNYEEHVVSSASVSSSMVDSTFSFKSAYSDKGGIKMTGDKDKSTGEITYKYDVRMKRCAVTWELKDYTKYIKTVRWDLKNTGYVYNENFIVDLFANTDCSGDPVDSDHLCLVSGEADRCVQMLNNSDETITAVTFRQRNESFDYGFEKLQYILGEASAEQQIKNFAKDFMSSMTCSGEGSITAENGMWSTIEGRAKKLSTDAKNLLKSYEGNDAEVLEALVRYDYIVNKYGTNSYSNFLNRQVNPSLNSLYLSLFGNNKDSSCGFILIACFSFVGLTAIGCFYFYRKRKETL